MLELLSHRSTGLALLNLGVRKLYQAPQILPGRYVDFRVLGYTSNVWTCDGKEGPILWGPRLHHDRTCKVNFNI